ncbi:hypothetical protein N9C59_06870 [Flavobacteriales bacterium]|nr:hypothetical protein [Flavobacteriales bacterium]
MKKTYYGLRIKGDKVDSYDEDYKSNNRLLATAIEFLGNGVFYRVSSSKYDYVWLVEGKDFAEKALADAPDYEDDAINYEKMYFTDGMIEVNTDDIEVVKIDFSTDINEFSDKCFCFLNEEKVNKGEFLPLGWEAKQNDDQPEDDEEDPEIIFGPNLSCPMVFWESKEKIDSWTRGQLNEYENIFKGTPLSYKISTEN